ncbi:MAG: hypothetical protein AMXMBFR25_22250 [Lysobacterales bacterium]
MSVHESGDVPLTLVIGNKNYSSWSLRPWVLLHHYGIDFLERRIALDTADFAAEALRWSPVARVPVLVHGPLVVWDSLAIVEYLNEQALEGRGWPADVAQRARARSLVAEMHAGFAAMRSELPMNVRRLPCPVSMSANCVRDLGRVRSVWNGQLERYGGPWLFGADYGIADAFYAPVAFRLHSYAVAVEGHAASYLATQLAHAPMRMWATDANAEVEVIESDER